MRIPRRAESADRSTLAMTFVAAGSFSAVLHSTDHQILYGRRGTGKTHALFYLSDLVEHAGDVPVYLDLRTIGSAEGLYTDSNLTAAVRGTHLLVDTLEAIHEQLLLLAFEREVSDPNGLLVALDALAEAATAVEVVGEVEQETKFGGSDESSVGVELVMSPNAKLSAARRRSATAESRLRRSGIERNHVVFGPLSRALKSITRALGPARLWLLLDEWSSVPLDLQPLLADLLRRSILPTVGITVKIAAIERRSQFSQPSSSGDYVGIEVGADAASAVSLDDSMIFDNVRDRAQEFFGQLLFNHASTRLRAMIPQPPPGRGQLPRSHLSPKYFSRVSACGGRRAERRHQYRGAGCTACPRRADRLAGRTSGGARLVSARQTNRNQYEFNGPSYVTVVDR